MIRIILFTSLCLFFLGCTNEVQSEKSKLRKGENEDDLILRYSAQLIATPRTQDEIDQNIILNFLIDSLFDFQKTASGIYYQIEKEGEGGYPNSESQLTAHYRGTLLNGKEFDSSYRKGFPFLFSLNQVIPGWQEGLQMLKPGGKGTFIIPSRLAYGEAGLPGLIEPNSVLMFEVELLTFR